MVRRWQRRRHGPREDPGDRGCWVPCALRLSHSCALRPNPGGHKTQTQDSSVLPSLREEALSSLLRSACPSIHPLCLLTGLWKHWVERAGVFGLLWRLVELTIISQKDSRCRLCILLRFSLMDLFLELEPYGCESTGRRMPGPQGFPGSRGASGVGCPEATQPWTLATQHPAPGPRLLGSVLGATSLSDGRTEEMAPASFARWVRRDAELRSVGGCWALMAPGLCLARHWDIPRSCSLWHGHRMWVVQPAAPTFAGPWRPEEWTIGNRPGGPGCSRPKCRTGLSSK